MKRSGVIVVVLLVSLVPACLAALRGSATIKGTQPGSTLTGTATLVPTAGGLRVFISVANARPGKHGIHFHEHGDCGDAGKAAGGHFNPEKVQHGFLPKDGPHAAHAGDMGNLEVKADGTGSLTLTLPGLSLTDGPYSVKGRAVILHEHADDFSQPTGNAGGRVGCGVIAVGNN